MVYKFFCLLLPFFKDRTGKPAEPFYFSQDHLSRAAKSCAGVFFYRAEPANPRCKAYLNPIKQAERLAQYRVKGRCPLRVQGGARRSLPQGTRRQAPPNPTKQVARLALIAARQSPPTGETRTPRNKSPDLCPLPQAIPPKEKPEPHETSRQTCAHCRRQSPPTGAPKPQKQVARLAPNRVKGHCPLRVQGGARKSIAARQSPPTGETQIP